MNLIGNILVGLLIVLLFIVIVTLIGLSVDYEKSQCIQSGGKWISGVIGGHYSYFCVPSN